MPVKKPTREIMPLYLFIALLTFLSACGLLGSDEDGGLLTVTPVSAVEVLLEVKAQPSAQIGITRDGTEILSFIMEGSDTLLTDTGLTPNTTYNWQARRLTGRPQAASRQATTLDTTSHAFTWQKFEFGEYSSSSIKDVAVIDENNIWAVGEIYMNDSTGQEDVIPYNAVHWDGNEWEVKRITVDFRGNEVTPPLESIQAFSHDDIWIVGSLPIHGDGNAWRVFDIRSTLGQNLTLQSLWGQNTSNLFFVGRNGSIAHYNGEQWQKLESSTSLNINDIWGSKNHRRGKWEILAIASNPFSHDGRELLRIEGTTVTKLSNEGLSQDLNTLWFMSGLRYMIGGDGIYQSFYRPATAWKRDTSFPAYYKETVRGAGLNDIVIVGAFGLLLHFNGADWKHYDELMNSSWGFGSVAIKDNLMVVGGGENGKGIVLIGRRE